MRRPVDFKTLAILLLLPLAAFAMFVSWRYLVVAADSATAAIFAGGVSGMATPAGAR